MIINLTTLTTQRLRLRAQSRGVRPERYVEEVLERDLAAATVTPSESAIAERRASLARMAERAGELWSGREHRPIPDGAFSSESLYDGND